MNTLTTLNLEEPSFQRYEHDFGHDRARLQGGLAWYRALALEHPKSAFDTAKVPTTMVWSSGDGFMHRSGIERCEAFVDAPYELVEHPDELARVILERVVAG